MRDFCLGILKRIVFSIKHAPIFFFNDTATTEIYTLSLHDALPIWDAGFARDATASDIATLIAQWRAHGEADLLVLTQQPLRWQDQANPFALLPRQPSVNSCPALAMAPGAALLSNSFRRRLRGKERKLQALSGFRYFVASTDSEI